MRIDGLETEQNNNKTLLYLSPVRHKVANLQHHTFASKESASRTPPTTLTAVFRLAQLSETMMERTLRLPTIAMDEDDNGPLPEEEDELSRVSPRLSRRRGRGELPGERTRFSRTEREVSLLRPSAELGDNDRPDESSSPRDDERSENKHGRTERRQGHLAVMIITVSDFEAIQMSLCRQKEAQVVRK